MKKGVTAMKQLMLLIGTRKGGFLAFSDLKRKQWEIKGPIFKGVEVNYLHYVAGAQPAIYIAGKSAWWGPDLRISHDFGDTWVEPATQRVRFAEGRGFSVERIWVIKGDLRSQPETLYAGVDPATLFYSTDGGNSWAELHSLTEHPTRGQWMPGAGGLMVHSICFDPTNRQRMFVGISAAGVFRTDDGGKSWSPKNTGVRADFLPHQFPPVGQCVHHLEMHSSKPEILYHQNHCGVYRSENAGEAWIDISAGLPSRFGFPLAVHPHDGDIIYVIPEESDDCRLTPHGAFRVYRSKNRGNAWEALTQGLPQVHAYQNVLRAAMTLDPLDPPGVYVGTQGGHLLVSRDAGDHWELLFNWFPPIYALEAVVIER
jgi:photosystem II stability/assembly factor-like uncharacterized protein